MIEIRTPEKNEFEEMFLLMWKMLRKPLGLPKGSEKDGKESLSEFVIAFDDELKKIVGTARLTVYKDNSAEIDKILTDVDHERKGIGSKLIEFLHKKAKEKNKNKIFVIARDYAVGFYKKIGYVPVGDYFITKPTGIKHIRMEKSI